MSKSGTFRFFSKSVDSQLSKQIMRLSSNYNIFPTIVKKPYRFKYRANLPRHYFRYC